MSVFWTALIGAFVGKILAVLFIGLCVVFGIGPQKWVAYMIEGLPFSMEPFHARIAFLFLGLVAATFLIIPYFKNIRWRSPVYRDELLPPPQNKGSQQGPETSQIQQARQEEIPIIIDFNPNDCSKDSDVPGNFGTDPAKKREYWFFVTAKKDINSFSVEVEKRDVIPERPNTGLPLYKPTYTQLHFEGSKQTTIDVPKGKTIKVLFVERTKDFLNQHSGPIHFTNTTVSFPHNHLEHHVHIKITGKGMNPIGKVFSVWVEKKNGNLMVDWPKVRLISQDQETNS